MKISRLLVLSALWLTGLSANAEIVDGVRQRPNVKKTETFAPDQVFYLFNTKARLFYLGANDYNTRASIGEKGYKVNFVTTENAGIYEFTDSVETQQAWKSTFSTPDGLAIWVDNSSETYRFWSVVDQGNGIYRISNPDLETNSVEAAVGKFLGWNGSMADTRMYFVDAAIPSVGADWQFVTEETYKAWLDEWTAMKAQFEKAIELKTVIDEAKEAGADFSAEEALYLDESSTVEAMTAAISALKEKILKAAEQNATPQKPFNLTSLITNPDYESAKNDGWSGTTPAFGGGAAEFYNKNFDAYQVVKNVPKGVYILGLQGYYRAGGTADEFVNQNDPTKRNAKMYAVYGENTISQPLTSNFKYEGDPVGVNGETTYEDPNGSGTYTVPNTMTSGAAYFARGDYKNSLYFVANDTVKIGLVKTAQLDTDWTLFDNWSLSYLGNNAEAYTFWVGEIVKNKVDYQAILDEDALYTEQYLTDYNAAYAVTSVSTFEEAITTVKAMNDAAAAIEKNISLWEQFEAVVKECEVTGADQALDSKYTTDLSEWAEFEAPDILRKLALTNEELETIIAEQTAAIAEAKKHPTKERPMNDLLKNPDFEQGETGWIGFREGHRVKYGDAPMPVTGGTSTNKCAEAFSTDKFDLYQIVENAPVGVYEISVQGFCRNGRGDAAWSNYENQTFYSQPGNFPVYVYLNAKQTPFVNVFSETVDEGYYKSVDSAAEVYVKDGKEYPDGMRSAAIAFKDGMYVQKAYGLVAREGDAMRIGVKGTSAGLGGEDDNWVIFDNFNLTFKGFTPEIIAPVLEEELAKASALTVQNMGKTEYAALDAAIKAGNTALEDTKDGEKMFEALSNLFDAEASATASIADFKDLTEALETLNEEINNSQNATAQGIAGSLSETISDRLAKHDVETTEIKQLLSDIAAAITSLRLPAYEGATDDQPVKMTVLNNPGFDENANGWLRGEGTPQPNFDATVGCVEFFNTNYDFYQELQGMPAGTYEFKVQAFYRASYVKDDYRTKDSIEYSNAFIYAVGADKAVRSNFITRLSAEAQTSEDGQLNDGFAWAAEPKEATDTTDAVPGVYVPNTMTAAGDCFLNSMYENNSVIVKVAEDGYLRVGIKKNTKLTDDWTLFDNFELFYYGKDSAKEVNGDPSGIQATQAAKSMKVEFFTLDGRKASASQRGVMLQKMTMENGTVVVKKILK